MNTPAHLLFGAALFGKRDQRRVTWAAIIGSVLPDLSLYLMAGTALFILGIDARIVFGQLYFSDAWQQVFAIDNSFVLWGIALGFVIWRGPLWARALCAAALLHLALDFPLHTDDARMHFWPLTNWKYYSPISYWNGAEGGNVVGLVELVLVTVAAAYVFWRDQDIWLRFTASLLFAMQFLPFVIWRLVF